MAHASKKIGSVQRAIDILNLFGSSAPELGTSEIARALGLHKSTAASLIYTLEANGLLAQDPSTRKYRLGLRLVERASAMLDQVEVRRVALPFLRDLRNECDETVNLAILDGGEVVYIERLLGSRTLGMRSEVGRRAAAHSTALGKAILSGWPPDEIHAFLVNHPLRALTSRTITDPERFLREVEQTRLRGFALDDEENDIGGRCIAAPIRDFSEQPSAAVSVSAPTARLTVEQLIALSPRVCETAAKISQILGYQHSVSRSFS